MAIETGRIYKYKVLQDMDLSQNSIYNPHAIINDIKLEVSSPEVSIYDLTTTGSPNNKIRVNATDTEVSGIKLTVKSVDVDMSAPNNITIGRSTSGTIEGSSLSVKSKNKLSITSTGRKAISDIQFDDLKVDNGSLVESSQVNAYEVNARDAYFDETLSSKDIKIYWDSSRKSLMFTKKK